MKPDGVEVCRVCASDKICERHPERAAQRRDVIGGHTAFACFDVSDRGARRPCPVGKFELGPAAPCPFCPHIGGDYVTEPGHAVSIGSQRGQPQPEPGVRSALSLAA